MGETTYSVGQFSKLIHKSVRTLHRWDKEGIFVAHCTQTERRYYPQAQYHTYFGIVPEAPTKKQKNVCYRRVSGSDQKNDLASQKAALERFVIGQGISVDEWLSDIGSGLLTIIHCFSSRLYGLRRYRKAIKTVVGSHADE